jgi:hypothetical protein
MKEEALMVRLRENLMNYPPPHRISMRKTVQLMVILTILAWATQTLFHQWGYGAVIEQKTAGPQNPPATVEVREQAVARSGVVKLKDVARWSGRDGAGAGFSEIVIGEFQAPELVKEIDAARVREALESAGISLADVKLAGASVCRVVRGDIDAKTAAEAAPTADQNAATQPVARVAAGDFVTVDFGRDGVKMQTVLKAIDSGSGTIRAKNEATGVVYFVKLTGAGEGVCLPYQATTD